MLCYQRIKTEGKMLFQQNTEASKACLSHGIRPRLDPSQEGGTRMAKKGLQYLRMLLSLGGSGSTQMWRAAGKKLIRRSDRSELPEVWGACPPGRKLCLIVAILRKVRA